MKREITIYNHWVDPITPFIIILWISSFIYLFWLIDSYILLLPIVFQILGLVFYIKDKKACKINCLISDEYIKINDKKIKNSKDTKFKISIESKEDEYYNLNLSYNEQNITTRSDKVETLKLFKYLNIFEMKDNCNFNYKKKLKTIRNTRWDFIVVVAFLGILLFSLFSYDSLIDTEHMPSGKAGKAGLLMFVFLDKIGGQDLVIKAILVIGLYIILSLIQDRIIRRRTIPNIKIKGY